MNLRNHKRTGAAVVAEALEGRQLMAGTITVSGGVMTITGTDAPNTVNINVGANNTVLPKMDGTTFPKYAGITKIIANLKGGADYFRCFTSTPCVVDGGNGADTIQGGNGNDTLIGGNGDDHLLGDDGNDLIRGGDGNDEIYGHGGNDTLYGDGGNDYLDGGAGNDYIIGGAGTDRMSGAAGRDTFDALDGQGGDILYFHQGEDAPSRWDASDRLL